MCFHISNVQRLKNSESADAAYDSGADAVAAVHSTLQYTSKSEEKKKYARVVK